ncbi:carbon-nitrogen hydrolase family protein [Palleronia caenipelagi]|uniref:Carbon-nitrogen hydrolase family protein n=1 Tax=Palleronia caenipelagi TaxID=2489174 RepID=A0A547Q6I0_9RHOB|nr:carbon-nitrogen hydrolase family protein [Palleronia caenipelagi]TRD21971.1 carbon-nitrogen hydrolase family protein [Palleronia caenipelagi]
MKIGLIQCSASDDPVANLSMLTSQIRQAAAQGAELILTPEVSNCVSLDRRHQQKVLCLEEEDPCLAGLRACGRDLGIWLGVGSLALKTGDADGRFANRSFLIDPSGEIVARYDKIHMFDVAISQRETYRESDGYRPGDRAVLAETPLGRIGMTICYDLRFPHLYRRLGQAGAEILLVPAAFSRVTGAAHWEPLLRARAIETGCYVLAAAQTGRHASQSRVRETFGHSMAVAPWGEVLLDMGTEPGVAVLEIDLVEVAQARAKVPSLITNPSFDGP